MFNSYVKLPEGNPLGGKSVNTLGTSGRIWQTSYLVGGCQTILKNMKVNGKDYPIYYGKIKHV